MWNVAAQRCEAPELLLLLWLSFYLLVVFGESSWRISNLINILFPQRRHFNSRQDITSLVMVYKASSSVCN